MIIVDETLPVGDIPAPFPARDVEVKLNQDMRDSYDLKKEIGRGRFGTVYLCTCKKTGLKFAAKFVNTKRNQDRENVQREIEIMRILNDNNAHQKLIQLYDAYDMGKEMCLVLEVVQGGELFERVTDDDFELTERACGIFVRQICEGIEFIHSKNILHLDMKPENILCLSREGNRIKICDFGLARKYDPRKKLQVLFGTPEFVAPEVVNFEPISFGTDMWSIGVICYVLLSGLSPFLGHNYVETMTNVTHNKYDFDDEAFDDVSDDVKDFIEKLLILDKSERLTPAQCFRHRWLRDLERAPQIVTKAEIRTNISTKDGDTSESSSSETESDSMSNSSTEMVIDAKLDIRLMEPNLINKENEASSINSLPNSNKIEELKIIRKDDESNRELIIVNVIDKVNDTTDKRNNNEINEEEKCKEENIESNTAKSTDLEIENNNPISENPLQQIEKNNSEIKVNEKIEQISSNSESVKVNSNSKSNRDENIRNGKNFEKQELERTKSNLREFVERWNSHPNSPYIIGSPKLPPIICQLAEGLYSRASFASIDVAPPSEVNIVDLENDLDDGEEFNYYKFVDTSHRAQVGANEIVQELEQRLEILQSKIEMDPVETDKESEIKQKKNEPLKHPEIIALQKENSGAITSKKPKADEIKIDKDANKRTEKDISGMKHRPSRDVINQPDKKDLYEKEQRLMSPNRPQSPASTPGRRSRKHSREKDDRPPSRDSDRSTPMKTRRRPSRDVPLSITQTDRLSSLPGMKTDRTSTLDLWPDMICLSKDEADSSENEGDYKPIMGKLELPGMVPSSVQRASSNSNIQSVPTLTKLAQLKKARSFDEAKSTPESKTITWVMDLETAQLPFTSHSSKVSKEKEKQKVSETETSSMEVDKLKLPKTNQSYISETSSSGISRTPSSSSIKSCSSIENLTIQTPWGPMKKSPSKTSLKASDSSTIINISECFINITKSKTPGISNPGQTNIKITPSIEINRSVDVETKTCDENRKRVSEKSKDTECKLSKEVKDEKKNINKLEESNHQTERNDQDHPYSLTSSSSIGKYASKTPNNIKSNASTINNNKNLGHIGTNENQSVKVKKKDEIDASENIFINSSQASGINTRTHFNSNHKDNIVNISTPIQKRPTSPIKTSGSNQEKNINIPSVSNMQSDITNSNKVNNLKKQTQKVEETKQKNISASKTNDFKSFPIPIKVTPETTMKNTTNYSKTLQKDVERSTEYPVSIPIKCETNKIEGNKHKGSEKIKETVIQIQNMNEGNKDKYSIPTNKDSEKNIAFPMKVEINAQPNRNLQTFQEKGVKNITCDTQGTSKNCTENNEAAKSLPNPSKVTSYNPINNNNLKPAGVVQAGNNPERKRPILESESDGQNCQSKEEIKNVKKNIRSRESLTLKINSFASTEQTESNKNLLSQPIKLLATTKNEKQTGNNPERKRHIQESESNGQKCQSKEEIGNVKPNIRSRGSLAPKRNSFASTEQTELNIDLISHPIKLLTTTKNDKQTVPKDNREGNVSGMNKIDPLEKVKELDSKMNILKEVSKQLSSLKEANQTIVKSSGNQENNIPSIVNKVTPEHIKVCKTNSSNLLLNSKESKEGNSRNERPKSPMSKKWSDESKSDDKDMKYISQIKQQDPKTPKTLLNEDLKPSISARDISINISKPMEKTSELKTVENNKERDENCNFKVTSESPLRTDESNSLNYLGRKRTKSQLSTSASMTSIPISKYEAEKVSSMNKPPDSSKNRRESNRNSLIETGDGLTNSLRRRSKSGLPPVSSKKSIGSLLFSAQDRISQFEQKKEDEPSEKQLQKPISRSRTNIFFGESENKIDAKSKFNRSSLGERSKYVSPVLCSKSEYSNIEFMRNRLLHKAYSINTLYNNIPSAFPINDSLQRTQSTFSLSATKL